MNSPDDPNLLNPKPDEWQQGEIAVATRKAMIVKLAEGAVKFCRLCGVNVADAAVDDLVAVLEKHS